VYIARYAAKGGSIEVVEWLQQQHGIEFGAQALSAAAGAGQTAVCALLHSQGCALDHNACKQAAVHGHHDTLRWLHEQGCPWDVRRTFTDVAGCGYTNILAYFIQQGEVIDAQLLTEALNGAGASGRLQTAKWLRQHGAQWPSMLIYDRVDNVELWSGDALKWARTEGCTAPAGYCYC
jgi:hypothetical protein